MGLDIVHCRVLALDLQQKKIVFRNCFLSLRLHLSLPRLVLALDLHQKGIFSEIKLNRSLLVPVSRSPSPIGNWSQVTEQFLTFPPMPFWKHLLWPLAWLWGLGSMFRNYLYRSEFLSSAEFEIPVISIGNLTMGGSGKTPHTEYFLYKFRETFRIAVLSRGYRRRTSGFRIAKPQDDYTVIGDESRQIKAKFPQVTVAVGESRALAIPSLLQQEQHINLIILDDAYQHRSVKPALNILLTPYSEPFWRDHLFPVGWLRENKSNYDRADIIIVTKCPGNFTKTYEDEIRSEFQPDKGQKLFFSTMRYGVPYRLFGPQERKAFTSDMTVLLFSGIARGMELEDYIKARSKEVYWLEFNDHYNYEQRDLETLLEAHTNIDNPNKLIVTTEKDAVKLEPYREWIHKSGLAVFCLPIQIEFVGSNKAEFDNLVMNYINYFQSGSA